MTLRIGCDMDGVLADFASAYDDVHERLFGPADRPPPGSPQDGGDEVESRGDETAGKTGRGPAREAVRETPRRQERRRDAVWDAIKATPDFWTTLAPIDAGAVRRLHALMCSHRWEVVFITQRPPTAGETVQRQTQRWLIQQGFDMPSVLVIHGSRGAAAGALHLDYHVDDSPQNCLDVRSDSSAKPLLIVRDDPKTAASARQLGVGVVGSMAEALDVLDRATIERANPRLLARLALKVGWR